jgi:hypothetical protein
VGEEARDRVGMLCDQLSRFPDLYDIIRDAGAGGELDKLLDALSGEDEPDEDQALVWLQAIDDACARKGLAGITSREHAFRPLPPGLPPSRFHPLSRWLSLPLGKLPVPVSPDPSSDAWVCPRNLCARVVLPEETQTRPVCAVADGTSMRPFALPPSS